MSRAGIEYQGVSITDKYLTVTFTLGLQAAKRIHEVKVPIEHLIQASVTEVLHQAVARNLKAYWEDGAVPLFDQ